MAKIISKTFLAIGGLLIASLTSTTASQAALVGHGCRTPGVWITLNCNRVQAPGDANTQDRDTRVAQPRGPGGFDNRPLPVSPPDSRIYENGPEPAVRSQEGNGRNRQ